MRLGGLECSHPGQKDECSGRKRKRKKGHMKTELRLQHKDARMDTWRMATWIISGVLETVGVQHDCEGSVACPAWLCEYWTEFQSMVKELELLTLETDMLESDLMELDVTMKTGMAGDIEEENHLLLNLDSSWHGIDRMEIGLATGTAGDLCQTLEVNMEPEPMEIETITEYDKQTEIGPLELCHNHCSKTEEIELSLARLVANPGSTEEKDQHSSSVANHGEGPEQCQPKSTNRPEKCQNQAYLRVPVQAKPVSPVKDLISMWESRTSSKPTSQNIQTGEILPKTRAKPKNKRVWARLKNGLFGWKTVSAKPLQPTTQKQGVGGRGVVEGSYQKESKQTEENSPTINVRGEGGQLKQQGCSSLFDNWSGGHLKGEQS